MKSHNPYIFFNEYCLRTPLFPLEFYSQISQEYIISETTYKELWQNKILREAIFLASPELFIEITKWITGETSEVKKIERLQSSLLKYVARMSSRCTPFGLFAGCSMGEFNKTTQIELKNIDQHRRQTRFDMNFLVAFSQKLSKEPKIKKQLLWYPNNSLYKIGSQYRYVEYTYNARNRREHAIEAVSHSPYLETILEHARTGSKIEELAILLVDDDISVEEAEGFIDELITNQLLVSEMEPSLTGDGFLAQLKETLYKIEETEPLVQHIEAFQKALNHIDQHIGNPVEEYQSIQSAIKGLDTPFEQKYLFQTDMYSQTLVNTLEKRWGYKLKRLMPLLNKMTPASKNTNLERFKNAFTKRYETREVPLTTVLDTEIGIGYLQDQNAVDSTPFLDDLRLPAKRRSEDTIIWTRAQELLRKKLETFEKGNEYILQLTDDDFEGFEMSWNDLPDTISAMVEIVMESGEEKVAVSNIGGSSATNLLGRFTTGDDAIYSHVKHMTDVEEQIAKDKIIAEIIHLPESRTGNVIRRATVRAYEIPYLGKSSQPDDKQISIEDLMISIKHNRVFLRSIRHNKEVIPKLSNAHNFRGGHSLPIYYFLCDLQHQHARKGIGFHWGQLLSSAKFLPRVVYKDFILSKAQWKINKEELGFIVNNKIQTKEDLDNVRVWREQLRMPQWVQLIENDNTLLINLHNIDSIQMWMDAVKNRKGFVLEEFLFNPDLGTSVVKQDKSNYTNQFVISFYNEDKLKDAISSIQQEAKEVVG